MSTENILMSQQAKELLFPVYTFMLVAFLKAVVDIGGHGEPTQWQVNVVMLSQGRVQHFSGRVSS